MKPSVRNILICPDCKSELVLKNTDKKKSEIDGYLNCLQCKHIFPIIEGIPNLMPKGSQASQMGLQREFWEDKRVLKRRTPIHPVIEAFAMPKVNKIVETIRQTDDSSTKPKTLLDVGSGNGYFSYYLNFSYDVTCLDFSHNILSICPIHERINASAINMPFRNNSFDIVFCANLLHHVKKPSFVINEMIRVSSRYLVIIEPNRTNPLMFFLALVHKEDKEILKFNSKYIINLLDEKMEILLMEKTGFILPNVTPGFLLPVLKKIELFMVPKIYHILIAKKKNQSIV